MLLAVIFASIVQTAVSHDSSHSCHDHCKWKETQSDDENVDEYCEKNDDSTCRCTYSLLTDECLPETHTHDDDCFDNTATLVSMWAAIGLLILISLGLCAWCLIWVMRTISNEKTVVADVTSHGQKYFAPMNYPPRGYDQIPVADVTSHGQKYFPPMNYPPDGYKEIPAAAPVNDNNMGQYTRDYPAQISRGVPVSWT